MAAVQSIHKPNKVRPIQSNKELSGAHWAKRFLGSNSTRDLSGTFRHAVDDFIYAMTEAGIDVVVDATYRPTKRSYLMHWSWRIVNDGTDPAKILQWQASISNGNIQAKPSPSRPQQIWWLRFPSKDCGPDLS